MSIPNNSGSGIYGNVVIYDSERRNGFVDGMEAINSVPLGGLFMLVGDWYTRNEGVMHIRHSISVAGSSWRHEHGSSDF